jgi:hypothetical protein
VDDCESIRSGSSCSLKKIGDEAADKSGVATDGDNSGIGQAATSDSSILPLCGLEDDERMLSFLQSTHKGDFHRAKLTAMVGIDRGYGKILCKCLTFDVHQLPNKV